MASDSSHGVKDYLKILMLSLKQKQAQHKSCVHGASDCWSGSRSVVGLTPVPLPEHFLNAF